MPDHPDANLHPVATGRAKQTVDAHQQPTALKMYAGWFCPFVQRTWLVLEEKNIPYQYIEVNPYHKPESLMKLNPRGLVPTIEFEGKPLYESVVLCELLDEAYPDQGTRILPKDLYERAKVRIWTDWVTSRFVPAFQRFLQFQPSKSGSSDEGLKKVQKEFLDYVKEFTKEMDSTGPYFLGSEPTLVDFVLAPFAVRFWVFDHFKGGIGIPAEGENSEDEQIWNRWRKWYNAIKGRKSVQNTTSEREYYLSIYQKYADDVAQSDLAKNIRQGRGVP